MQHILDLLKRRSLSENITLAARVAKGAMWNFAWNQTDGFQNRLFDLRHGVDTRGTIPVTALDISESARQNTRRYQVTLIITFRKMMQSLAVDCREFTFVDIGAGKGRSLLLAAEYPFRRILGIEHSPMLVEVAQRNISRYRYPAQKCFDIVCLCDDALKFEFPLDNLVCFLSNPFEPPLVSQMLARLRESLTTSPRLCLIAYYYPKHVMSLLDSTDFLHPLARGADYGIWRASEMIS